MSVPTPFGVWPSSRQALPAPEAARATLVNFIKSESERLTQRSKDLWAEVDGPELSKARDSVLFDDSDEARRMAGYEKTNAAEVHKCLNALAKKRREEGRSENRAAAVANRVSQAVSSSNGNGHEPFVMPQPLSERVSGMIAADSEVAAAQPMEARSENRPEACDPEVVTAESSPGSGALAGSVSAGEVAAAS